MPEIKVEKTIFAKLQQDIRVPISKMNLKKTGKNTHLGYEYFTLDDFLPQATELIAKAGLCTVFSIGYDANGIETASLLLTDGMAEIRFVTPTAEVPRQEGIFNLGSKHTYCKRYLYMNLLELTEPDVAEITNVGTEPKNVEEKKATEKQIEMIVRLYDSENIAKMLEYYKVKELSELTLKQASQAIENKRKNNESVDA